jgi:hypothetical protein
LSPDDRDGLCPGSLASSPIAAQFSTDLTTKEDVMAPLVAALLSKGLGLVANAVLAKGKDYVKDKTGIDLDKAALSDQDVVALKKFEMEHEEELMRLRLEDNRLDVEMQKLILADVQGARERETKMAESPHASWLNKNMGPLLGLLAIALSFLLFYQVLFDDKFLEALKPEKKDILLYILGVLSAIVTQIFSYYFGSSTGSKAKSEDISRALESLKKGGQS